MNKKNKNKNRSKPTNPVPSPPKAEPSQTLDEALTVNAEEKAECAVIECESCVETVSEKTLPSAGENDLTDDLPKKPKRKKEKKKKQEEPTLNETKLDLNEAPVPEILNTNESEIKNEFKANAEFQGDMKDPKIEQNIAANVSKKKNKKKQNEKGNMEEHPQDNVFSEKSHEDKKGEGIKADLIPSNITESEAKTSKKKNKKKKHGHDSEKLDKVDELTSCTASTENEAHQKSERALEIHDSNIEEKNIVFPIKDEPLKDLTESASPPEEPIMLEGETTLNKCSNESKNKKKNKKDKKQLQVQEESEKFKTMMEQNIHETFTSSIEVPTVVEDIPLKDDTHPLSKDKILKSKAKIAKPVEKKPKGNTELSQSLEKEKENDLPSEHIKETEKFTQDSSTITALSDTSTQVTDKTRETENVKEDAKKIDPGQSLDTEVASVPITSLRETPIVVNIADTKGIGTDANVKDETCANKTDVNQIDLFLTKSHEELEKSNKASSPLRETDKKCEDNSGSTELYKTVEKKKKKHPKKIDVAHDVPKNPIPEHKILVTPDSESTKVEMPQNQKADLSSPELVEISSLKKNDKESSSETTPDFIHHPLATSQQLIDNNNNNMFIREVTSIDEKLYLPLLIPTEPIIIQGSGETPEPAIQNISVQSTVNIMTREESKTSETEKTDLKSKMMEVSQDMEELRLSIERSLAELTSMEKSEQNVEKTFEVDQAPHFAALPKSTDDNVKDEKMISEVNKSLSEDVLLQSPESSIISTQELPTNISETIVDIKPEQRQPLADSDIIQIEGIETTTTVKSDDQKQIDVNENSPMVPARKDHKGKGKGKRKNKQETQSQITFAPNNNTTTVTESSTKEVKKEEKEKSEHKGQTTDQNKGKQQSMQLENDCSGAEKISVDDDLSFEPCEHFEDALTSSIDDVNKTFEMIASEVNNTPEITFQNPEINIIAPAEGTEPAKPRKNPVSPPKNLLGHPDFPVPSNRTDYKKEKNKTPNMRQAKVKIKEFVDIEPIDKTKQSKKSQTENRKHLANNKNALESFSYMTNQNAEYVYKYSFRKVFLQSLCHVCRKELIQKLPCQFCSLVFYCSQKHKDEDWPQHQSLCFAVCTIVHLKDQKHIYAEAKNITGQNYRLLRMQMIISCEKVLKRKLVPWEQEALLYPRICADVACREWKKSELTDCAGCAQISYCTKHPEHLPSSHQRWCRSYALYQKLVHHQQTKGRMEPQLPARIMPEGYRIPEKINDVLAALFDEKIDMNDAEYAALTQLATAPLTVAYAHQLAAAVAAHSNGLSKKTSLVVHLVGAELQFEADVLFKWELFLLHLLPGVRELRLVLISPDLNPFNLPLDLLGKINVCASCRAQQRRVGFSFQDKMTYSEYWSSDHYQTPDIVCAFNPSIQRSSMYNGKDTWPIAVSCILKLKTPFLITSYSINELHRDVMRIKECSELSGVSFKIISEPKGNPFASVRPDRNFITDDEIPLLFKNYCFAVLCGI